MTRVRTALPLLLALLAATACTGDGGGEKPAPAKPPRLKQAWSVPSSGDGVYEPWKNSWLGKGILAFRTGQDGKNLVGHATSSGEQRWQLPLPKGTERVCALSKGVNAKGIGGILLDAGDGDERCSVAAAVDIRRGKVLWSKPLGETSEPPNNTPGVSVGETTLTATVGFHGLARFSLEKDGRKLPALPHVPKDRDGVDVIDHDGQHIALHTRSEFAVYDADKGTRLWHRPVAREGARLEGLVSADPVVLDAQEKGHRNYRAYGPGKPLGKELITTNREAPLTGRGILVATFADDPRTYAYDMRTGKRAWTAKRTAAELDVGIRNGALLSARQYSSLEKWLVTHDLRTGAPRTLGRLTGLKAAARPFATDARRLYVLGQTRAGAQRLIAYELPPRGTAKRYTPPATQTPVQNPLGAACDAVTPRTLRTMKLADDRPPPESCHWVEQYEPRGVKRELEVETEKHDDVAEAKKEYRAPESPLASGMLADARPVRGVGTEAKSASSGGSRGQNRTIVLARHRDITVQVVAGTETLHRDKYRHSPSPEETERAARSAAADVLRSLRAPR
ncbi:hypothetical protein [Streptomyces sp. NPDC048172]|uniref:hypothetical protein n=1 Tax=Streptomyces sp. NPDC048172 TaxID=3365505 RepID=UPI00371E5588